MKALWLCGVSCAVSLAGVVHAEPVSVSDVAGLRAAIEDAAPGDVITMAPGEYAISGNIVCRADGEVDAPIVVRAEVLGEVRIKFDAVEGFHVVSPGWVFENLDIEGVCADHSQCEHAFHITGRADRTVVRGSRLHEFNAMIKGNGDPVEGVRVWPDDVLIEHNEFFSASPRQTGNPVTPIDVVGGRRWVVRGNFIHDHAKGGGNGISYAAFLKGNSRAGLIEGNLVVCELLHTGRTRLGLSFGGGGSGPPEICEAGTCTPEHQDGVMRNNIIVNCPADVGIYLNAASNVQIFNNTLINTTGIDVRFEASVADLRNNLLMGRIRSRDGGTAMSESNLELVTIEDTMAWFEDPVGFELALRDGEAIVDQGVSAPGVLDDFCRNPREDGRLDLGALEYDSPTCDTRRPPLPSVAPEPEDAGLPDVDPTPDADVIDADDDGDAAIPDDPEPEVDAVAPGSGSDLDETCACRGVAGPVKGQGGALLVGGCVALWWVRRRGALV